MQSIISPLVFFDLDISMSYPNFTPDSERNPIVKTEALLDPLYPGLNYNAIQPQQLEWSGNTVSSSMDSYFAPDGSSMQASMFPSGLHNATINPEEYAMWTWGPSPSDSPHMSSNGGYIVPSTSSSPAASSVYSHEDAMPSPLQLNEHSNVFDFDFHSPLPTEYLIPEQQSYPLPSSISRRTSPSRRNPHSPDPQRRSRETSPTNSDSDPKRRFPCLILGCARRFTSQYTLRVHMEAHKPKPRVSFPCTLGCSERFSRQHDRLRHEVAKHGKVCEFLCHDCGRFFSTGKTLSNHKCPVAQCATRWINTAN